MRLFAPLHLLLLAVLSARCAAQVAPVQNRYHVTGIVVNSATGAPIRRALVRIGLVEPVLTGADGRFQVDSPEGRVGFSAQKPGFVDSGVPQNGLVSPLPYFTVGPGKNDIVIKLSPEGTVQGRVVDADGEPIEGVPVQLTMQAIVNGRKQSQPRQSRSTNEDGTYRMDALTPGTYLVQTDVHPVFTYYDPAFPPGQFPQVYPQSFYPGSPDISGAQPIELKPGEVAQADFTLSPVRAFRVSGSIAGAQHGVLVFLQGAERQQIRMLTNFDQKTGHFVLPSVPPGVWSLRFLSASDQGTYEAEQTVTIDSSDVDGVQVLLQPLPSIRVNVDTQGEAAAPQLQIQLVPKDSQHSGGRLFAVTQIAGAQSALTIRGVEPGEYQVVPRWQGRACVESLLSGNIDLTQNDLTVAAGSDPQPIHVTLRKDCATVNGTVRSENQPISGLILLIPKSISTEPKVIGIGTDGSFSFPNLSPGEYRIYAFSNIDGLEYANPDAMGDFAGQKIELAPNQKLNLTLDLIVRGSK